MQVPLACYRSIVDEEQFLDVWRNGRMERVPAPFRPYCFVKEARGGFHVAAEPVDVRPLSTLAPASWTRLEFRNVRGVPLATAGLPPLAAAENHLAFVERVLVDEPDFFRGFPNTDDLRVLTLDIEQLSTGRGFPTARDPLISIGVARGDAEPACFMAASSADDAAILAALAREVREYDPDVVLGYNVDGYDLPMIVKRLAANHMDATFLSRDGSPPAIDEGVHLTGRLVYDVFDSVKLDQTLYGIKDLKLKTVGRWMGLPVIEEDVKDTRALVGTERLRRYNVSDVEVTRRLSEVYLPNHLELAELYGAPLNLVLRATSSFHTTVLQGRVLKRLGIVSDGTNGERYARLYEATEGMAFVGGIVEIYARGVFRPVWKVDFSSMYPSIMVSLACGGDNTRLADEEPFGPFVAERRGDVRVYHVPDESRKVRHVIEVAGESPVAAELARLLAYRMELKQKMKATADAHGRERLRARQGAVKVILNSVYGVNASAFARYGSLPVAIATVGVARELIRLVEGHLGDTKIETDTDGVYASKEPDLAALETAINDFLEKRLGAASHMRLDAERFEAGYFHQKKSYLLLHKDGRLEKHGVAFKGSSLAGLFDQTVERVGRALLTGSGDPKAVARACLDMPAYEPRDFVQRLRLGKDPTTYVSGNALGAQLARRYKEVTGQDAERGTHIEYVKTRRGYDVLSPEALKDLDVAYYRGLVQAAIERLGVDLSGTRQASLAKFFP